MIKKYTFPFLLHFLLYKVHVVTLEAYRGEVLGSKKLWVVQLAHGALSAVAQDGYNRVPRS